MTGDKNSISSTILRVSLRTLINAILVFILVEGFIGAYYFSYKLFADFPYMAASHDVSNITISEGQSAKDVGALLEECGIVEDQYLFLARAYLGKYNNRIQAGTYTLGPGMTPDEICRKICGLQSGDKT